MALLRLRDAPMRRHRERAKSPKFGELTTPLFSARGFLSSNARKVIEMAQRILRRPEVEARTGRSRSGIYELKNPKSPYYDPEFPQPVRIGKRAVGWRKSEIDAWLETRTRAPSLKPESMGFPRGLICDSPYLEVDHGQIAIT